MFKRLSLLGLSLLVAACASRSPTPTIVTAPPTPANPPGLGAAKPSQIPKHGGGYYQDDGPVLDVPYDLDALPEPEVKLEPPHRFANRPYQVFGQDYAPIAAEQPYVAEGVASWYGRKFHGKRTSSGEPYDVFKLTGAHPELPIPSYVRVTNLENDKSVVVRINDRGPFHKGRLIDLSYAAAYRLGYIGKGSAKVRVEALRAGEDASANVAGQTRAEVVRAQPQAGEAQANREARWLQLGAFSNPGTAEAFRKQITDRQPELLHLAQVLASNGLWKVRLGPYDSAELAQTTAEKLAREMDLRPLLLRSE